MSEKERRGLISSGKLISIGQAAASTPYSQEYLSLLARKGRLRAIKLSRDWLTTQDTVLKYVYEQKEKHKKSKQKVGAR